MTATYQRYLTLLEELCAHRRKSGWDASSDQPLLDASDEVFEKLSDEEKEAACGESWRASPARVTQAEAIRAQIQAKLTAKRAEPISTTAPSPRYDAVYVEGMDWLEKNE